MNITINENLKKFRREKGNTQQELADHLGISIQAVSKWECGDGYPDITLIPAIALYYKVTSDELLGMTENNINAKIQEYIKKDLELHPHETYKADRIALWREARKEFPDNHTVLYYLINSLYGVYWEMVEGDEIYYKEVVEIGERLLRESTDNDIRFNTIYNLSFCYMKRGDFENAKKYADMLPGCWSSKEALYSRFLKGEEAIEHNQRTIISYVQLVCEFAGMLWINMQNKYSREEIIKVLEFTLALNRLVYPDGDFHNESEIFYNLFNLACFNLCIGENEKALSYIEEMPEHFIKMYTDHKAKHTSFLVNKIEYGEYNIPRNIVLNIASNEIQDLFENENRAFFGSVKNDERYITAIEKMRSFLE
jgi:Predicted transcriptional regulators